MTDPPGLVQCVPRIMQASVFVTGVDGDGASAQHCLGVRAKVLENGGSGTLGKPLQPHRQGAKRSVNVFVVPLLRVESALVDGPHAWINRADPRMIPVGSAGPDVL